MPEDEIRETEAETKPGKVECDWGMDPSERLTVEAAALPENDSMGKAIAARLLEEFAKDENLKNAYRDRKVTLKDVIDFVNKEARKEIKGNSGHIADDVVYGWAIHYVLDGTVPERKEPRQTVTLSVDDKAEAHKKAVELFTDKERKKIEDKAYADAKKEAAERVKAEAEAARKAKEAEKARKAEEAAQAKKEAKAKEAGYVQTSLFDFCD